MKTKAREDWLIVEHELDVNQTLKLAGVEVTASAAELNQSDLSVVGAMLKIKKIAVPAGDWSAETDSGWDLPAKALVLDMFIDVTTLQAGKTVDIGLKSTEAGGDADGFGDGLSLAATGLVRPGVVQIAGATETYVSSWTRGVLLTNGLPLAGANVVGDEGVFYEKPHMSGSVTAKSLSYTTNTAITAVFDIYVVYLEIG